MRRTPRSSLLSNERSLAPAASGVAESNAARLNLLPTGALVSFQIERLAVYLSGPATMVYPRLIGSRPVS